MKRMTFSLMALPFLLAGAAWSDSLFTASVAHDGNLLTQRPARFQEGDIITVLVEEVIDASTQADTKTKKESGVDAQAAAKANTMVTSANGLDLMHPDKLPNWNISSKNETKDTGRELRRSEFKTNISCFVTEVLPNGNIKIAGERKITVNREDSILSLIGTVRARDVTPQNTVDSKQVANAQIDLKGKGSLWNNQRRGLITRFLDWFSPF